MVLAGGYSPEREVSLTSGSLIANALMEKGHRVLLLDLYIGMNEIGTHPTELFSTQPYPVHTISDTVPDLDALKAKYGNGDALIGKNVLALCALADRVFLALHGAIGENGQLQATLDTHGIRYTGSGYLGSALAMDKEISKRLLAQQGIPTPHWLCCNADEDAIPAVETNVGYPCVIKPLACGSSVGVAMAENRAQLRTALLAAAPYGKRVLVETKIIGRELTVGILDGAVLPPVEIIPKTGFYNYTNKYDGTTEELCPAPIPNEVAARLAELTKQVFDALRLRGYARLDYILDADGTPWCLEANTLPGMTPSSLLPMAARTAGMDYGTLCEKILEI